MHRACPVTALQYHVPVRRPAGEPSFRPSGQADLDPIHRPRLPQPEVGPRVAAASEAAAAWAVAPARPPARSVTSAPSASRFLARSRARTLASSPGPGRRSCRAGPAAHAGRQHHRPPSLRTSPTASPRPTAGSPAKPPGPVPRREVAKHAVAVVGEELVALGVAAQNGCRVQPGEGRAVADTVPLVTTASRPPSWSKSASTVPNPVPRQAGAVSPAAAVRSWNRPRGPCFQRVLRLVGQVGDEQVLQAVAVHVAQRDAHVGLGLAHAVEGHAARHRLLLEGAVAAG